MVWNVTAWSATARSSMALHDAGLRRAKHDNNREALMPSMMKTTV
jgi:hypothetical protein